jgi:hypothetical protein
LYQDDHPDCTRICEEHLKSVKHLLGMGYGVEARGNAMVITDQKGKNAFHVQAGR